MSFTYHRTIRFQETDAAGVVYFANVLSLCHEAYEASLAEAGMDLKLFFSGVEVALPIAHARVDFFRPMHCGDRLTIQLTPTQLNPSEFELAYEVYLESSPAKPASKAQTRHVCIDPASRKRCEMPVRVVEWLRQLEVGS